MDDLTCFCCLNPECPDSGTRGGSNLAVHSRYGPQRRRILRCRTCGRRSSERKGTPLFRAHLSPEKADSLLEHLTEGCGVRQTGRLVKVPRDTVMRDGRLAGPHAHDAHDELVAFSPNTREAPFDEKWSFVAQKQAHCDPADPADEQKGDWWDHVGDDPEHRLVVAVVPGARNAENAEAAVAEFRRRTGGRPMRLITSDEHRPYWEAVLQAYGVEATATPSGRPARTPHEAAPPSLCSAAVHKVRWLGRVAEVVIRLVFGTAALLASAVSASAVCHGVIVRCWSGST